MLILWCFSHKSRFWNSCVGSFQANYVWRKTGQKREKLIFVTSRNKTKLPHWIIIENHWHSFKKIISHNKKVRANISRVLQNFKLILFVMSYVAPHKYAKFSYSSLQLLGYTAYRSLQKVRNLMVRHLTRPYFQESCGNEVWLWGCYITKKPSQFRNKVANIVLVEANVETFNTFVGIIIIIIIYLFIVDQ